MGDPNEDIVAKALAAIRAAGRGDLLAPEPAGPSSRSVRPARRASAGVAAAIVSCSSSPSRASELEKKGRTADKGKGIKGRGGDKGKGPASKNTGIKVNQRVCAEVSAREIEEMGTEPLLEEGELESESEEEMGTLPIKRSRREVAGAPGRGGESDSGEGEVEAGREEGLQGHYNLQEETGWYGQGRGEALENRARGDTDVFSLQKKRQERGDGGARGQQAQPSRSGPPDSHIFSLRGNREEDDSGVAGEQEIMLNVWKNLLVESNQRLEGKLEKRLAVNYNEMLLSQRNKDNHWKQLLDDQTVRLEKVMGESRRAVEKVLDENRVRTDKNNSEVHQNVMGQESGGTTRDQRWGGAGRGEESGRMGSGRSVVGNLGNPPNEGLITNNVVAIGGQPATAIEIGATEVAVLAINKGLADAGNTLAGTPAVQGTMQSENCDEKGKRKKLPYMGRGKQLGAHLMKATKEKIWEGEYVEIFKLLHREIRAKEGSKEEERELARRPYVAENIENWISAFSILASVYCEKYPERAVSLFKYMDIIRGAQTNFGGLSWLKYDEEFRARMSEDKELAWGQLDEDLWLTVMARPSAAAHTASGHVLPFTPFRGRPTFGVGSRPSRGNFGQAGAGGRGASSSQGGPCWNFNRGFCSRQGCWYEHKCKVCGGAHPVTQCWGGTRGSGDAGKRGGRGGKGGYTS